MRMLCLVIVVSVALVPLVTSHGSVVRPLPRQAVDRDLAPWTGLAPEPLPRVSAPNFTGTWCPIAGVCRCRSLASFPMRVPLYEFASQVVRTASKRLVISVRPAFGECVLSVC